MINEEQGLELHEARDGDTDNSASEECVIQTNIIIICHMVPIDLPKTTVSRRLNTLKGDLCDCLDFCPPSL